MAQRGETEDGLGWGGLVASKAELREERRQAQLEKDAERYRKLVASGNFCAASSGAGWGLVCGTWRANKAELDAAADALPAVG